MRARLQSAPGRELDPRGARLRPGTAAQRRVLTSGSSIYPARDDCPDIAGCDLLFRTTAANRKGTSLPTLHRTGSRPSNDNRPLRAGETIYAPSAGTLSRLRELVSGKEAGGASGALVEDRTSGVRIGASGIKRDWRLVGWS